MGSKVFLGFEDELITQNYQSLVNYTTNKVGGKPDWMENKQVKNPLCKCCGLILPLVVQIYAPLEKNPYHRTLYLFGCVNPNCWNLKESWVCLRSQLIDTKTEEVRKSDRAVTNFDWCDGANSWEDEQNGNTVDQLWEEQSFDNQSLHLSNQIATLSFNECKEEGASAGAVGQSVQCTATAEIEGEDELVTIDTPDKPSTNVVALFDEVKQLPQVPSETLQFVSFFMSVSEENQSRLSSPLTKEFSYQSTIDEDGNCVMNKSSIGNEGSESTEKYEKTLPPHGDKMFHNFISRIQKNPGQILRYIRDGGSPLFLYPERDIPQQCLHCGDDLVYELQLLPTLLSRLQLLGSGTGHIEFGSVFVLACKRSCWAQTDSFRSEHILVQREL